MSENSLVVTDDNFDEKVVKSSKPVLVDFWASWCHPCKVMSPIIDEIATETKSAIIAKLNVDENPQTAERFDVMSIPSFVLFENGEVKKTAVGSMDKGKVIDTFRKWLE
jgi:thioredoxin 1